MAENNCLGIPTMCVCEHGCVCTVVCTILSCTVGLMCMAACLVTNDRKTTFEQFEVFSDADMATNSLV